MSANDNAALGEDIPRRGGDDQQASRGPDRDRWGPEGTDLRRSLKRGREDDQENRRSSSPTSSTETLSGPAEQGIYHDGKSSSAWAERAKAWRNDHLSWPENDGKSTGITSNAQSASVAAPSGWGGMHTHLENAPTNRAAGQQSTARPFDSSEGSSTTTASHSAAITNNTSTPTDQGRYLTSSAYTPQATRAPPSSTPSWHVGPHQGSHPSRMSNISMLGSIGTTTSLDAAMLHSSGNRVAYGCGGGVGYNRGEGMMDCSRRASSSSREHYGDGHGVRIMGGVRADEISDEEILARIQDERRLSRNAREQKRSLKINVRFDNLRDVLSHCGAGLGKKSSSKSDILAEATDCLSRLLRQRARADEERSRMLHLLENAYQAASHNPGLVAKPHLHPSQQQQRQQSMASAMASMMPSAMSRNQYPSTSLQAQAGLNGRTGGNAFNGYIRVEDMYHHSSPNRPCGRASNGGPDRRIGPGSVGVVGPNNGAGMLLNSNGDMHRGGAASQLHSSQSSTAMSSAASAAMVHASKGFRMGEDNTVVDGRVSIGGGLNIQAPSVAVGVTSSPSGLSPRHTVGIVNSNGNVGSVNGLIDTDGVIAGNGIIPANGIVANGIVAVNSGCTDDIAAALLNSSLAPRIAPSSGSSLPAHHGNIIGNNSNNGSLTAHLTPAAAAALGASGGAAPPSPTQAQLVQEFTQIPAAAGTWVPGIVSGATPGTGAGNGLRTSQASSPKNGSGKGSPLSSHGRHQQGVAAADENESDQEWDSMKNHQRSGEITAGSSGAVVMTAAAAGGGEGDWGGSGRAGLVAGSGASTTGSAMKNDSLDWMFHASEVPMAIADMSCNLLDCNARLTQVTGLSRQDAPLVTIFDLVAEGFVQHAFSMIGSMLALPAEAKHPPVQVQGKKRDGSTCGWMQISVERDGNFRPAYLSICLLENATVYPEHAQR